MRVPKGDHVYLICSQAHAKAGCKYQAVPYADVERAFTSNADALFEDAPRGADTAKLEREAVIRDFRVSALREAADHLVGELVRENSEAVRRRLKDTEADLDRETAKLRSLKERIETNAAAYVKHRLAALRDCLKAKKIDITTANKALKEAVSKIVINPARGTLVLHWHHSETPTEGLHFASRHSTAFSVVEGGYVAPQD